MRIEIQYFVVNSDRFDAFQLLMNPQTKVGLPVQNCDRQNVLKEAAGIKFKIGKQRTRVK